MIDDRQRRAERRVRAVLSRIARRGFGPAPVALVGDPGGREAARQVAEKCAAEAGRDGLLSDAHGLLQELLDSQLGQMSMGTGFGSGSLPFSAEERAASAYALSDLITAAVVEDLVEPSVSDDLRVGGERLLQQAEDAGRAFRWEDIDVGGPVEPLAAPWAKAQLVGGAIGALIVAPIVFLFAWQQGGAVMGVAAAVATAVGFLAWAVWPRWRVRHRRRRRDRRIDR